MITNRKGLSDVVTTVLIILLVIVAIGTIWQIVRQPISNAERAATKTNACLSVTVDVLSCKADVDDDNGATGTANTDAATGWDISVKSVQGKAKSLKFIFEKSDGTTGEMDGIAPSDEQGTELNDEIAFAGATKVGVAAVVETETGDVKCSESPRVVCK